jgi:sterol desaturase/sphingolipid hydroxylase (fatty acid hydroxylase superfamily)
MEKLIVFAFPVFALMILGEVAYGIARGRNTYRVNDAVSNLSQGVLSQITALFTGVFHVGIYTAVYLALPAFHHPQFWSSWYGWILALVLVDFCGYWAHRCSHGVAILWAAHVVHHQSQDFNFSTALRQESAYPILGSAFYLPLAVLGVAPENYVVAELAVLLYQVWIHTEQIGKLGWFDRIFSSPSNHRVHHAVNGDYVDRNFGGVLILWDRIFGTYVPEGAQPCVYGTRRPLDSWDPLRANLSVYALLLRDAWRARRWRDKARIWFMPPGWRPGDVALRYPEPPFDLAGVRRYDPPVSRGALWFGCLQFAALLAGCVAYLWYAQDLGFGPAAVRVAAMSAGLWVVGRVFQGTMQVRQALLADTLVLAALALAA